MGEMDMGRMGTRVGLSLLEGLSTDNSISRLILSNNLLYNWCFLAQELIYLGKNSSSKIVYVKWKMIYSV